MQSDDGWPVATIRTNDGKATLVTIFQCAGNYLVIDGRLDTRDPESLTYKCGQRHYHSGIDYGAFDTMDAALVCAARVCKLPPDETMLGERCRQ